MGYHFEDLFEEHILPQLKELVESNGSESKSEEFISIIKRVMSNHSHGEKLAKRLLWAICDTIEDDLKTPDTMFSEIFSQLFPDYELKKVEYSTDIGSNVTIDYHDDN